MAPHSLHLQRTCTSSKYCDNLIPPQVPPRPYTAHELAMPSPLELASPSPIDLEESTAGPHEYVDVNDAVNHKRFVQISSEPHFYQYVLTQAARILPGLSRRRRLVASSGPNCDRSVQLADSNCDQPPKSAFSDIEINQVQDDEASGDTKQHVDAEC